MPHLGRLLYQGQCPPIRIISDLWWQKDGINNYISLKTVKPNIDQTAVAKEDCPYNPYGENKSEYAHNPPMGIFDFHHDSVVLIGKDMWDTIGVAGCYEELIDIARAVGVETKQTISRMFNGR